MIASDLITNSYYLAGILDPDEQVQGYYLTQGLNILNDLIEEWSSIGSFITFQTKLEFELQANKYKYIVSEIDDDLDVNSHPITQFITGWVSLNQTKFDLEEVFASTDSFQNYELASGIPATVYLFQREGATDLFFYPKPSSTMHCSLTVKQRLAILTAFETIIDIVPRARSSFRYELAYRFADFYQYELTQQWMNKYNGIITRFKAGNVKDLSVNRDPGLTAYNLFNWWSPTGMVS